MKNKAIFHSICSVDTIDLDIFREKIQMFCANQVKVQRKKLIGRVTKCVQKMHVQKSINQRHINSLLQISLVT